MPPNISEKALVQIEGQAEQRKLPMKFHDKCDHLDSKLHEYKVQASANLKTQRAESHRKLPENVTVMIN